MASIQYYDVILKPVVTEKSMGAMGEKKYTFLVHTAWNFLVLILVKLQLVYNDELVTPCCFWMSGADFRAGLLSFLFSL